MQEELFLNRYEGVFPFWVSDETFLLFQEKRQKWNQLQMSRNILCAFSFPGFVLG